jgi:prepilin-type N-terminal cleavage/methylation domain-containing protein
MTKKGFTLTETLVALAVISVIAAFTIPLLIEALPDNNKFLFKSAYKLAENIVSELVADNSLYPNGSFTNATDSSFFCDNFSDKVNTIGTVTCTGNDTPGSGVPNFTTSNGMKWWGFNNAFSATENIWVDIDGEAGNGVVGEDVLRINIGNNGKLYITDTPEIDYLSAP